MTTILIRDHEVAVDSMTITEGHSVANVGYVEKKEGQKFIKRKGFIVLFVGNLPSGKTMQEFMLALLKVALTKYKTDGVQGSVDIITGIRDELSKTSSKKDKAITDLHTIYLSKDLKLEISFIKVKDPEVGDTWPNGIMTCVNVLGDNHTHVFGSGDDFTLGAFRSGAGVKEAVEIGSRLDPMSGGKVHYFNLLDLK